MNSQQVQQLSQSHKFSQVINSLTDQCWDICISNPGHSLDNKTQRCLTNCVERFLDTARFVSGKLEAKSLEISQSSSSEEIGETKWN